MSGRNVELAKWSVLVYILWFPKYHQQHVSFMVYSIEWHPNKSNAFNDLHSHNICNSSIRIGKIYSFQRQIREKCWIFDRCLDYNKYTISNICYLYIKQFYNIIFDKKKSRLNSLECEIILKFDATMRQKWMTRFDLYIIFMPTQNIPESTLKNIIGTKHLHIYVSAIRWFSETLCIKM